MRKSEAVAGVKRWVLRVAEERAAVDGGKQDNDDEEGQEKVPLVVDAEERAFDVDKETVADKDGQLFTVADQMIKSQLAKIDVPLLGALNLDESESEEESDSEAGDRPYYYEPEDYDMDDEEDEDEYDDEYDDDEQEEEEEELEYEGAVDGSSKRKD